MRIKIDCIICRQSVRKHFSLVKHSSCKHADTDSISKLTFWQIVWTWTRWCDNKFCPSNRGEQPKTSSNRCQESAQLGSWDRNCWRVVVSQIVSSPLVGPRPGQPTEAITLRQQNKASVAHPIIFARKSKLAANYMVRSEYNGPPYGFGVFDFAQQGEGKGTRGHTCRMLVAG